MSWLLWLKPKPGRKASVTVEHCMRFQLDSRCRHDRRLPRRASDLTAFLSQVPPYAVVEMDRDFLHGDVLEFRWKTREAANR